MCARWSLRLASRSINSGAPASIALLECSSAGIISSLRRRRVAYSCGLKHLGWYGPAVFSCVTRWCTWAASCAETTPAPAVVKVRVIPRLRSASRRERSRFSSDIAFSHLLGQVFRHAPRERDDAQRHVLVRLADEGSRVRHEQVPHVVRLAVLVERRFPGVVSHADGAGFVDDGAAGGDAFALPLRVGQAQHPAAHGLDDLGKGLPHVPRLPDLVLAPAE